MKAGKKVLDLTIRTSLIELRKSSLVEIKELEDKVFFLAHTGS